MMTKQLEDAFNGSAVQIQIRHGICLQPKLVTDLREASQPARATEYESLDIIRKAARGGGRIVETKITVGPKGREITKTRRTQSPNWQAAAWWLERRYKEDYGRDPLDKEKEKRDVEDIALEIKQAADALFRSVPLEEGV